jgi:uncharacterized protein YjbI with pentapeptide repeats
LKFLFLFFILGFVITFPTALGDPLIFDLNFKLEEVVNKMNFPVQMDFVGDDLLVIEKGGNVRLVRDGILHHEPVLQVDVVNSGNTGLLGITHVEDTVYLYMTQKTENPDEPLVNRIYKYQWNGNKLVNPVLVNEIPGGLGHTSGVMITDLEGNVFTIIGDLFREGFLQHFEVEEPDDTSVVLRVGLDDTILRPYLSENPFEHYYGIGIRNSFGLTIDPETGYLWQTENGPENFDEINLIRPGFDGGWKSIRGPASAEQIENLKKIKGFSYSNPEFSWETIVSPTGLTFIDSEHFRDYHDTLFVTDFSTGSIFKFNLNNARTGFEFNNPDLQDLVANPGDSLFEIIFGVGFGPIVDIEQGPDGFLYLISLDKEGIIYRIGPNEKTGAELSPRNLQDSGVSIDEIKCEEGLILTLKKSNGQASCLKPKSISKLIQRNWASPLMDPADNCNNPISPGVNWSKCNFAFSDLSEINLEGSNLFETNLFGSNFKGSNISNSDLSESNLAFVNFSNANFVNSKLVKSKSYNSDYTNTRMTDADLSKTNFSYSTFILADLSGADLSEAILLGTDFSGAKLTDVNFTGADLNTAKLFDADLSGADLSNTNLEYSNFTNADLSQANFFNARLDNSTFENVILNNTNLNDCQINPFCDRKSPSIKIKTSPDEIINNLGDIVIEGIASDENGIRKVEAFSHTLPRNGVFNYELATPTRPDDWSEWSIKITIPDNPTYRILARVTDNAGNQNWDSITINP